MSIELNFSKDFFEAEEREGFFVEKEMKHAWAAQLQVLKEFDEVCEKHDLKWMAAYGTLLGTVRHKGFIPWDDDIDVWMLRADYERFRVKAIRDLPKNYVYFNFHNDPTHANYMTRIVNHRKVDFSEEMMKRYYGSPYCCGIDIFPLDYIPDKPSEFETYKMLIGIISSTATNIEEKTLTRDEERSVVTDIEKLTRTKISRGQSIPQQLRILCDKICGMYTSADTNRMGMAIRQPIWDGYHDDKSYFETTTKLPFECTELPVPIKYREVLDTQYVDYMTPVKYQDIKVGHDYPFYKNQQGMVEEWKAEHGPINLPGREF